MSILSGLEPKKVFEYFEEITKIPRGSGDMEKIKNYCMEFAKNHLLKAETDKANNVIIYKDGTSGYENSEPVIIQGHLDMVCQKTDDCDIDFEKDGLTLEIDGDYVKAVGTTLGADNGIAVAMIFAILDSDDIPHPPIEAVFTTDEEIGMIGAIQLPFSKLRGKKMINIDAEEPDTVTVSCAGGRDVIYSIPYKKETVTGKKIAITISGLKGGHSGIMIDKGRVNADVIMGRILDYCRKIGEVHLESIAGGDKSNAIPNSSCASVIIKNDIGFIDRITEFVKIIKKEISDREPDFMVQCEMYPKNDYDVIDNNALDKMIFMLCCAPNGVQEMSVVIDNLVETSLNLGILKLESETIKIHYALRSNKVSALDNLENRLKIFSDIIGCDIAVNGSYPPWEFKENSIMQKIYAEKYKEKFGVEPKIVAIHAGLECGVFSEGIPDLDCIAVGALLEDVHTVNEKLCISSTKEIYELILQVLKELK